MGWVGQKENRKEILRLVSIKRRPWDTDAGDVQWTLGNKSERIEEDWAVMAEECRASRSFIIIL